MPNAKLTESICKKYEIDPAHIPAHVAIVMDGNGRWAERRGLVRTEGHAAGEKSLWDVTHGAVDIGIRWLTVFAFSTENWNRPQDEVEFLMWFNRDILIRRRDELDDMGVRVRILGRRGRPVPKALMETIEETEAMTKKNRVMTMSFCFNYGGRAELLDAFRALGVEIKAGRLDPYKLDEKHIKKRLYAPDMPDPDLVIRTSGEERVSNFLLWEAAYSEFVFPRTLWPDFRRRHLYQTIRRYQQRSRRFGGLEAGLPNGGLPS